jgi:hypothetical protein
MSSPLAELKAACTSSKKSSSDLESIKHGVSTWFRGLPAPASPGTIALAIGGDAKVIINEGDIRSVEKVGEHYRVEVSAESHFLLRIDKVMKATATDDCGCKKDLPSGSTSTGVVARDKLTVWEICQRICGIIVVGGISFFICVDINCITLDPNIPPQRQ